MTAAGETPLVPDAAFVAIQCVGDDRWFLANFATQERVQLPPPPPPYDWMVVLDSHGFAGALSGTELRRAADMFELKLCEGAGRDIKYVCKGDDHPRPLQELFSERILCTVGLALKLGEYRTLQVLRFRLVNHGCVLWWSLPALHAAAGLQSDKVQSKWVYHNLDSWSKWLSKLQIVGQVHLRRVCTKDSVSSGVSELMDGRAARLHEFPAVSTVALLALLVRLSADARHAGGLRRQEDRDNIGALLSGLIDRMPPCDFQLAEDDAVVWEPPCYPEGDPQKEFTVVVRSKCVDMAALRVACVQMHTYLVGAGIEPDGDAPLVDVLKATFSYGGRGVVYFKQLVWNVGMVLDEIIRLECDPWGAEDDPMSRCESAGVPPSYRLQPSDPEWGQWRARKQALLKYHIGTKEAFRNEVFVSMSVDISRVGGRSTLLGVLASPSGKAAWMPPQAIRRPPLDMTDCSCQAALASARHPRSVRTIWSGCGGVPFGQGVRT